MRFSYIIASGQQLHVSFEPAPKNDHGDSSTLLHDVYAVTRPSMLHRALTQSIYHWSIYCNGHFYHLSKPEKLNGARTILKDDDLSHEESADYEYHRMNTSGPLVAYQLGQTDYSPDQIYKIAEWVIARIGLYNLFKSNCQHFVLSLAVRIICSRRDNTVFVGHTLQIVNQDRLRSMHGVWGRNSDPFIKNGFSTGFQLASPNEDQGSWFQSYLRRVEIEVKSRQLKHFWPYGLNGMIPDDIMEWNGWKRYLFLVPDPRFSMGKLILRPKNAQSCAADDIRTATHSFAEGLLKIFPKIAFLSSYLDK
ncbi:hypothetical protein N7540_011879 [Penicillium herquei]|nr:hypothetical protein N7540_011879 [Penicillium herquei]